MQHITISEFIEFNPVNSEVDYHGQTGTIKKYLKSSSAIVYFDSTDEKQDIDIEELIEQNY